MIEYTAAANGLPVGYLSRLLWTESRFSNAATSPAGAEGIAQFMPETAAEQGLRDPWDPAASITHAARLLVDLHRRFGNLGLAAAAYNAGPGQFGNWLQGSDILPAQTRRYVRLVTGRSGEAWVGVRQTAASDGAGRSCAAAIAAAQARGKSLGNGKLRVGLLPFLILPDGEVVSRKTEQPLTVAGRLAMHSALSRAVGLSPGG